jgi:GAF domain-containing protein
MAPSFSQQLRSVGTELADGRIDHPQARERLGTLLQQRFACSRVSYWAMHGEAGERVMRCGFNLGGELPLQRLGATLSEADCPAYFAALQARRVFACGDTLSAPELESVRHRYLQAGAARAMLDAAFAVNGRIFGVLCCEQTDAPRSWTQAELMALMRCANSMALYIARFEREWAPQATQRATR